MWRKHGRAAGISLMLLIAVLLGFWSGYRMLPANGQVKALHLAAGLLYGSLPYATTLATEATEGQPPAMERASQLLLQSSLTSAAYLDKPIYYPLAYVNPAEAEEAASGHAVENPDDLPVKAEPRLIMITEDSVQAFAALSIAAEEAATQAADAPLIVVYCTHSSEEYRNQARVPGERGGVHTVAQQLCDSLNALGLPSIYCDTIHDYPDWDLSYASSLASMQKLQQQYPSLRVFIDVHRDSPANSVLATANGNVARMMFVVGSNTRLEHPHWQRNKVFSEQIQQTLEAHTPGITRSVNVQQGRYNQHISDKAILVEMGSTTNTVEEACVSAQLLARSLATLLQ